MGLARNEAGRAIFMADGKIVGRRRPSNLSANHGKK